MRTYAKVLGDLRAEQDHPMLQVAFFATPDYKTLVEGADRPIVVGRRGTGKSALAYRLRTDFARDSKTIVIDLAPSEDQVIGLRPLVEMFGTEFRYVRAGSRIAWKYALLMEVARAAIPHYRFAKATSSHTLRDRVRLWGAPQAGELDVSFRLRNRLRAVVSPSESPATRIGNLASSLGLGEIEEMVRELLDEMGVKALVLADKLDEGFEPDDTGVGLVAGFVQAALDINSKLTQARTILFLRDNIFRTVAREDPDFSRNIEGQVLRLHWDDHLLLTLVAQRLRAAFSLTQEQSVKVWNACVSDDLQGVDGFRRCLRLTLYRPRDLLALVNDAFLHASRDKISHQDVEATAATISVTRLDDLRKEYAHIFPSLPFLLSAFRIGEAEMSLGAAASLIEAAANAAANAADVAAVKDFEILGGASDVLRGLYSVGFVGIRETNGSFVFCHDGKKPDRALQLSDRVLIHPCYWMALNLKEQPFSREQASEIHDDYAIVVASGNPEIRNQRLGQLVSAVGTIPTGLTGAASFEEWCHDAIRISFAGALTNVELHPNGAATQRRDVVATNTADVGLWRRIRDDYKARQVIFEVKNFAGLDADAYRQMHSYLGNAYGSLAFIVTRDENDELLRDRDLRWVRELYNKHRVLVIRLTAEFFRKRLGKLRSPQKHNEAEQALQKLLDTYERLYVSDARTGTAD